MFEIVKIDAASATREAIRDTMNTELLKGNVVVLKGGLQRMSRDDWGRFLARDCGYDLDRRQYNYQLNLELVDWWEISYQPERATMYAYSNTRQPFHNDNAWFADPAEVNFFVMEKQARSGGEGFFYPVPRLFDDLQAKDPGLLHDLTSTPVVIRKGHEEYFNRTTILVRDPEPRAFWNYYRTEKDSPEVNALCERFFTFLEQQESTSSVEWIRCNTGDAFAFHDQKLLHGRAPFEATKAYDRVLFQSMWRLPTR